MTTPKPKILFADPSKDSGGPQHVGNTILAGLPYKKYELILGSPLPNHPMSPNVIFRYSPDIYNISRPKNLMEFLSTVINFPLKVFSLCKFIKKNNIDLIHSNNEICFSTLLAARLTGTIHIVHVHGLGFAKSIFSALFAQIINGSCTRVIAVSNAVSEKLKDSGVDEKKIITVYNGINTDVFKPTKKTKYAHRLFGISEDSYIVSMISALDPRKGHELFIQAANYVQQSRVNIHFLIIGDCPDNQSLYEEELRKLITKFKLNTQVTFTGYQDNIPKLLNSIDLIVQPSITDAGPLVPLESMSCGTPVIATNVGGNPEEVVHGYTGLVIPMDNPDFLGQSIINLIDDPNLRLKMRNNGRKWVKTKFDSQLLTGTIESIYDELLQNNTIGR